MAAFWAEMGVAYIEINKLPCLHEILSTRVLAAHNRRDYEGQKGKSINVNY
jgi:hypothetical protein